MIDVAVKQYIRSEDQIEHVTIELPNQYIDAYNEMTEYGFWFEAEVLQSSQVTITISNGSKDVDSVLVENGPGISGAMEDMLLRGWWRNPACLQ